MKPFLFKPRPLLRNVLLAYIALSLLLLVTPSTWTNRLRHIVLLPLSLAQRVTLGLSRITENTQRNMTAGAAKGDELRLLHARTAELEARLHREIQMRETAEERLRQYERLAPALRPRTIIAHIAGFGPSPLRKTAILNKGTLDGITRDSPVLWNGVIAGRVASAEPATAQILLIGHPEFRIAVRCVRTRVQGVMQGTGPRCQLKYIGRSEDVEPGDTFVTSGLDALFPPGYLVGRCVRATNESGEIHKWVELQPACDTNRVETVAVLAGKPIFEREEQ